MSAPLSSYKLFTPLALGKDLVLKNRVVMSPLTRGRSEAVSHVPNDLNVEYYRMRAGAGLIISEGSPISPQGFGWYGAPGIYTDEQVAGWKKVTQAVHEKEGKIFLQLWHMGRQAHSSFNDNKQTVSSSALQLTEGRLRNSSNEYVTYEEPRAIETDEVPSVVEQYRRAGALAKEAGFDGVEIHGANGYLVDQFLQSVTNKRTDKYGGSIENRTRFLIEVVEALKTVWDSHRIGVRLAPNGSFAGMGSPDNYEQFVYTMGELSKHNLAYLALLDAHPTWPSHQAGRLVNLFDAKLAFKGNVFANVAYTRDTGEGVLRSGTADAVVFGRLFISNPDLAERFMNDWPLEEHAPREAWYAMEGGNGYTSYKPYAPPTL